jgi:CheY-like chemotaxis protein
LYQLVIVSEVKSFFVKVIKEKLEALSFKVDVLSAEMDAIHNYKKKYYGLIIYADEQLMEMSQDIVYIKDRAMTESIPIFAIGDQDELRVLNSLIPSQLIKKEFQRPIDILKVVEFISNYINHHNQQKKILAVDDSGTMLRTIKVWLEDKYNVYLANSAAMAIKYLTISKPDLVLLDYAMPVVDGKQVLEMIRTESEFADIPVMFLTNKSEKEDFENVMYLHPEGYLLKSMDSSHIINAVNDFFKKQRDAEF